MRRVGLVACWGVAACFSPAAPLGAPCSDTLECPTGQECDLVTNTCTLPTELTAWRDDAAEDFARGTYLDEVTVEAQGFLGPAAYYTGGLRITGIESNEIDDPATTDFEDIDDSRKRGVQIIHGAAIDYGTATPPGFGFDDNENITILVEGELELDVAGAWRFQLTANDAGFVDIAPPGTNDFERLVSDDNSTTNATFQAAAPGWYRIRGAFANAGMAMAFVLRYDPPNVVGGFRAIPSDRVRGKAGDIEGLVVEGFEQTALVGHVGSIVSSASLADQRYGTNPLGLEIGTGSYSLRWTGQFLVDVPGEYSFEIDSRDGHRAWIDGAMVADKLTDLPEVTETTPIELAAGWHDLVVDTNKAGGGPEARLSVIVRSGPAMLGESFAPDHVRPVIGRGARFTSAFGTPFADIPDGAALTEVITMDIPASFAAVSAEVGFQVDHPLLPTLSVVLDPPVGANLTLAAVGSLLGVGDRYLHASLPVGNLGSSYSFIVTDALADTVVGTLAIAAVTAIGNGGVAPFEPQYRYESEIRDLGDVASFGALTWGLRQDSPTATATISMRSCATGSECAAEPWIAVGFDTVPAIPARRFAQYRVEMTTNGEIPTALDFIDLAYSRFVQ